MKTKQIIIREKIIIALISFCTAMFLFISYENIPSVYYFFQHYIIGLFASVLLVISTVTVIALIIKKGRLPANSILTILFLLSPVFSAFHWVFAPTHFGPGSGGLFFFTGWLTKYPDFIGINIKVLAGIFCVLGYHVFLLVFGLLPTGISRKAALISIIAASVLYVPVFIRLDLPSLWIALNVFAYFPDGFSVPFYRLICFLAIVYLSVRRIAARKVSV